MDPVTLGELITSIASTISSFACLAFKFYDSPLDVGGRHHLELEIASALPHDVTVKSDFFENDSQLLLRLMRLRS